MKRTTAMILMLLLLLPIGTSMAEAPFLEVRELFQEATQVYVARVESVGRDWLLPWRKVATATVLEVWKGDKSESVKFRASPSWTCDDSDAEEGEVVVLMLAPETFRYLQIVNSGQGRYLVFDGKVELSGWEVNPADTASHDASVTMSLRELRKLVSR